MKIIDRYLVREYVKPFLYTLLAAILIYLTAELFENIDLMIDNKATFIIAASFFIYKIPLIVVEVLPITCLIATLLTLTRLSRHNELVIFKVSGLNIIRAVYPILLFSLLVSVFTFVFNETVVPVSITRFKEIKNKKIYKRSKMYAGIKKDISYNDETGKMYFIKQLDPARGVITGMTVYEFDKKYRIKQRIDAREARWLGKYWILQDGFIRTFGEDEKAVSFNMKRLFISESPGDFARQQKDPLEMSFFDLRKYVRKMKTSGLEFRREIVELYTKISYPFTCFFIVLLGIPFALKTGRKGTFVLSLGISLLFSFIYWGVIALSKALGRSGVFHPIMAAWGANILFGTISLIMLRFVKK